MVKNGRSFFSPSATNTEFVPQFVVSVDTAALGMLPGSGQAYADRIDLAIDHHPSFEAFGQQNIVRPEAGACGELVYDMPTLDEIQRYCQAQMETLWDEVKRFDNPHNYYVDLSQKLWDIKYDLLTHHK